MRCSAAVRVVTSPGLRRPAPVSRVNNERLVRPRTRVCVCLCVRNIPPGPSSSITLSAKDSWLRWISQGRDTQGADELLSITSFSQLEALYELNTPMP